MTPGGRVAVIPGPGEGKGCGSRAGPGLGTCARRARCSLPGSNCTTACSPASARFSLCCHLCLWGDARYSSGVRVVDDAPEKPDLRAVLPTLPVLERW